MTCRDGGASNGAAACEDLQALVNDELGGDFTTATDFGGGCSLVAY